MKKTALFLLFLLIFSCQTVQKPNTYKTEAEAVAAIQQLEERKLSADEAEQKEIDTEISQIIKDMQRMQLIEVPVEVPIQKCESPVSAKNEYLSATDTIFPSKYMAHLSAICAANSTSCVTMTIVFPSAFSSSSSRANSFFE